MKYLGENQQVFGDQLADGSAVDPIRSLGIPVGNMEQDGRTWVWRLSNLNLNMVMPLLAT